MAARSNVHMHPPARLRIATVNCLNMALAGRRFYSGVEPYKPDEYIAKTQWLAALLDRIESEMGNAAPEVQWTMNCALAEIGIHFPKHRKRAIAIGEKLGIYRDYPVSKGCTSPFAPIWITAMVSRQG